MQIDDMLEKEIQEVCRRHNTEPIITWKNGTDVDFLINYNPVMYNEPKGCRIVPAIPRIHGYGSVSPYLVSLEVSGVLRIGNGLISASELDERNCSLKDILLKNRFTSNGSPEGLIGCIECVILDIETRLTSLERMRASVPPGEGF